MRGSKKRRFKYSKIEGKIWEKKKGDGLSTVRKRLKIWEEIKGEVKSNVVRRVRDVEDRKEVEETLKLKR